jgi:cytochrome c-type biogenesis protein CcmH
MKATTKSALARRGGLAAWLLVLSLPASAQQTDRAKKPWLQPGAPPGPPPALAEQTERAKKLGARLWCMCGCNQILTQCNHVGCATSTAMLKKLDALVARNDPDDLTIQSFVQEYGPEVLAQPPAKGLALMAYVFPGMAALAGLGIVWVVIRHWRRSGAATAEVASAPRMPQELLERARHQADMETDWEEP